MKSPLRKRIFREVRKDWKKYIVLTLLMAFMIALASGVNVANDSMMAAIDESYEKYNIESGHFELKDQATPELLEEHLRMIAWVQHERLVHLIVTVMVVLCELFTVDLVLLHPEKGVIPALLAATMIGVCIERIKEIKGGEEDDLSQY